jgi:hypothetical protein
MRRHFAVLQDLITSELVEGDIFFGNRIVER